MRSSIPVIALVGAASAMPKIPFVTSKDIIPAPGAIAARQNACFVIGSTALPEEVADVAASLASTISCSSFATTIAGVPDVTSGTVTYSSVDFSRSSESPLQFALRNFATDDFVGSSNLQFFQDALNVYLATEVGIRSVGGNLAIKVPKFFLEMQVSRIQTAQGNPPTAPGLQVDHLRDKVLKNAGREDQALLDQVTFLATKLQ
ncbi:hypothetical protein F5B22DRAFT_608362 [Xylaria bambusicola]|uniref:uncharacterized protein n=1 Tax=Xylaria bambusicola TaxID=326684 RepID=UPI002007DDA2|nr:uncharacterized protein F5B22DRAFT_608362 [Xylaria bambusicola]KAI0515109.1 hypothetical protein F5B22DRAFT_608362 [Xylaria bambusicola]